MRKSILIGLFAAFSLSAGSSNNQVHVPETESDALAKSIDNSKAKVDNLLVRLKTIK